MVLPRHQAGFTLLELMLVVLIAGILAGMAVPSMLSMYRRTVVSSASRDLYSTFLEAQGLSVSTGKRHRLLLDRNSSTICTPVGGCPNGYWAVQKDNDDDSVFETTTRVRPLEGIVAFGPVTGFASTFPVPYDTVSKASWCTPVISSATSCSIVFSVEGKVSDSSNGSISLRDGSSTVTTRSDALVFIGSTGDVRLFKAD